jgi:uncharacterized protein YegP (UPF0339 family)
MSAKTRVAAFEWYKNEEGEWQWTFEAANGENWANAEGYTLKSDCLKSIDRFIKVIQAGEFVIRPRSKK